MSLKSSSYLAGYPDELVKQVHILINQDRLGMVLLLKYPNTHSIRTDKSLYDFVLALKQKYLHTTPPINRVEFDSKLHILKNALGTHTTISRVQGGKLKAKREIRIASLFKETPEEFLRMIVVHELAHMKERQHDKAFYQLCSHMEPAYAQLEFDLRAYLTYLDAGGLPLWSNTLQG